MYDGDMAGMLSASNGNGTSAASKGSGMDMALDAALKPHFDAMEQRLMDQIKAAETRLLTAFKNGETTLGPSSVEKKLV